MRSIATAMLCVGLASYGVDSATAGDQVADAASEQAQHASDTVAARRAELVARLRAEFAARGVSAHDGPVTVRADGSESVTVGAGRMNISVAKISSDGKLETQCVQGVEQAAAYLADPAAGKDPK